MQTAPSKRLIKDVNDIITNGPKEGIYFKFVKENDYTKFRMMIIGPKGPYENCLFFFTVSFAKPYPLDSPTVKFHCSYSIRCHPNLYRNQYDLRDGKVCLSILGTWSGPPWTPMMTFTTIAQTVLMILDDNPLCNEPAYYNSKGTDKVTKYTEYVEYVCLKESAVLYQKALKGEFSEDFADFKSEILNTLLTRKERIDAQIEAINTKHAGKKVKSGDSYGNQSYAGENYHIDPISV
jgi:ubiquitin-protein ligase